MIALKVELVLYNIRPIVVTPVRMLQRRLRNNYQQTNKQTKTVPRPPFSARWVGQRIGYNSYHTKPRCLTLGRGRRDAICEIKSIASLGRPLSSQRCRVSAIFPCLPSYRHPVFRIYFVTSLCLPRILVCECVHIFASCVHLSCICSRYIYYHRLYICVCVCIFAES